MAPPPAINSCGCGCGSGVFRPDTVVGVEKPLRIFGLSAAGVTIIGVG